MDMYVWYVFSVVKSDWVFRTLDINIFLRKWKTDYYVKNAMQLTHPARNRVQPGSSYRNKTAPPIHLLREPESSQLQFL
jgi:hypothetical protein